MVDISFILPTNREHSQFANKVIRNIHSLNFNGLSYEILVISKNKVFGEPAYSDIIYVEEPDNVVGCVEAYNIGYIHSSGRYIILCSDDHRFNLNAPNIIKVLESDQFKDRKYKIICLPTNYHGPCRLPDYTNCPGWIARYPVFSRETIEKHLKGFVYHPEFKHHYPDNWLGYWLYQRGEPVIEYPNLDMITFSNSCIHDYDTYDEEVFKSLISSYSNGYIEYA